jgi:hypothetical protein
VPVLARGVTPADEERPEGLRGARYLASEKNTTPVLRIGGCPDPHVGAEASCRRTRFGLILAPDGDPGFMAQPLGAREPLEGPDQPGTRLSEPTTWCAALPSEGGPYQR